MYYNSSYKLNNSRIIYQDIMAELKTFFLNYSTLLEQYLLAQNQEKYLQGLNYQNRKFFNLIFNPVSVKDQPLSMELGLSTHGQIELDRIKLLRELKEAKSEEEKKMLLEKVIELNPHLNQSMQTFGMPGTLPFSFGRNPFENNAYPNAGLFGEIKPKNILVTEQTVEQVVRKSLFQIQNNFSQLTPYGFKHVTPQIMSSIDFKLTSPFFTQRDVIRSMKPEMIAEMMGNFFKNMFASRNIQEQEFPATMYDILTLEQVEAIRKKVPKMFNGYGYYQRTFLLKYQARLAKFKRLSELSFEQQEQKRGVCLEILKQLQEQKSIFSFYYIEKLTEELLLIEQAICDSNIEHFISYLSKLRTVSYEHLNADIKQRIKDLQEKNRYIDKNHRALTFLDSSAINQSDLIGKTVVSLFKKGQPNVVDRLAPFVSKKHLVRQEAKVKLSKGLLNEITNLYEIMTTAQQNELKASKLLTFSPRNRRVYKAKDKVELSVTAKNIKEITVKLFSVDLQKHYLSNKTQIDETINLKFLVPKAEPKLLQRNNDDAFVEEEISIDLPELEQELGLFIIDLEGGEISSRAIIRKGVINVSNEVTEIGHQLTFFNEEGEKIPELVVWRNNKKINVLSSYTIPFGPQSNEQVVVVYQNYAQRETIGVVNQNYTLSTGFIYNTESFIVGNKAKIVVQPQLRLVSGLISLERITKATVKVTTMSSLNVPSTVVIENVKFIDSQEYAVQIPIKSYLSNVTVGLEIEVEKIDKTIQKLANTKSIPIDIQQTTNNFIDLYLNKSEKGLYRLEVKGLNGESIPNSSAVFAYQQFGSNYEFRQNLVSDQQGLFQLGTLAQVRKLSVSVSFNGMQTSRTWKLNNLEESISYGSQLNSNNYKIYMREGESLTFPVPQLMTEKDIIFYHENEMKVIRNCYTELKVTDSTMTVDKLLKGRYTLILLRLDRKVEIEVVKGRKWINDDLIDQSNTIYEIKNRPQDLIALGELTTIQKEDHVQCDIKIVTGGPSQLPKDLRLHIFAKNYIDSEIDQAVISQGRVQIQQKNTNRVFKKLSFKQSKYLSNKRLSDQTAYVISRRKEPMKTGTNLQKPHIFLKNIEVAQTSTTQEQLVGESNYRVQQQQHLQQQSMYAADLCDFGYEGAPQQQYAQKSMGGLFGMSSIAPGMVGGSRAQNNKINTHNNFLNQVGHLLANTTSLQSIKIPKGYSEIIVYAITNSNLIKRQYSLPAAKFSRNSQTHTKLKDEDEKVGWAICREIHHLHAGKQQKINKNCQWNTVSKVNVIEYAKGINVTLPEWVTQWRTYSEEKKLETYDEEFGHELNFFLFKHDPPFFQKVVRPFIKNRLSKTFLDLYLMGSSEVLEYATAHKAKELNDFQCALLVQSLADNGRQKQATKLAQSLSLPIKPLNRTSMEYKTFFEMMLNAQAQSSQNQPVGGGGVVSMASNMQPMNVQFNFSNMQTLSNMNTSNMGMMSQFSFGAPQNYSGFENRMTSAGLSYLNTAAYHAPPQGSASNYYPQQQQQVQYAQPSIFGSGPAIQPIPYATTSYQQAQSFGYAQPRMMQHNAVAVKKAQSNYRAATTYEKIKEYTDTTYTGIKKGKTLNLIPPSLFWAELASHYSLKKDQKAFLSDKFNSFRDKRQFIFALSVLLSSSNAEYELQNAEDSFLVTARSSFMIFAKEIKACPVQQSANLVIRQRFFDEANRQTIDEQGNRHEKAVQQFVILKPYILQTIISNVSSSNLDIQILVDIPEGSIPLKNHNKTQIKNITLSAYSTTTFDREFYFPSTGTFSVYPANASKNGMILSKSAKTAPIAVVEKETIVKSETLEDILKIGSNEQVYSYLREKNIFDANVLSENSLLEKLKSKEFFLQCIKIFKERNYYNMAVWSYSFYHRCFDLALEYLQGENLTSLTLDQVELPVFEYHPYYSNRVHTFGRHNRSNFKINELRQTYAEFLSYAAFYHKTQDGKVKLVMIYYLLLQDRIKEASQLRNRVGKQEVQTYQLQYDYIDCFIDVSVGAEKGYIVAKKISQLYLAYPVKTWRSLFTDVHKALFESDLNDLQEISKEEEPLFNASVTNDQTEIKIKLPAKTTVLVHFYKVDLELYFSQFPFSDINHFSAIAPQKTLQFTSNSFQIHTILKKDHLELGDVIVQIYQQREQAIPSKLSSFLWTNAELRVKLFEKEGFLKVFYQNKKCPAYCKVYARGAKGIHFYKDGYTDIASTFRYAMNVDKIEEFSMLVLTDFGGCILKVKPPSLND